MCLAIAVMMLFGAASANESEMTDASGQWKYVVRNDGAVITKYVVEPCGDLVIPNELDGYAVSGIGDWAFVFWDGLISVMIPDSVTSIGRNPFAYCDAMSQINVSPNNSAYESIDGVLFDKQQKMLVSYPSTKEDVYTIPEGVLLIGDDAFSGCRDLISVIIPDSVTGIGDRAFEGCFSLASVTIPDSVTSIGDYVFEGCYDLANVTIPSSVTSIGSNPFRGCPLESISLSPDNPAYREFDGVLFNDKLETLIAYPGAREGAYVIPEGVLRIGNDAFADCVGLISITIPDSVTSIGEWAFTFCEGLTNLTIGKNVTSIGTLTFAWCKNLTSIFIPDGVTSIGDEAFSGCINLTSATIPASVTSIGNDAFRFCRNLTLSVARGSFTEQYAKDNDIPFIYTE